MTLSAMMVLMVCILPFAAAQEASEPAYAAPTQENNKLYLHEYLVPGTVNLINFYGTFSKEDPVNEGGSPVLITVASAPAMLPVEFTYEMEPKLNDNFSVDLSKNARAQITVSNNSQVPSNAADPLVCTVKVFAGRDLVLKGSASQQIIPTTDTAIEITLEWIMENATDTMFYRGRGICISVTFENPSPMVNRLGIQHDGRSYCEFPIIPSPENETVETTSSADGGAAGNATPGFEIPFLALAAAVCIGWRKARKS